MDNGKSSETTVYEHIKNAITSKNLYPNSQIVEMDLAKQLGVSRTPIRAAIKKLSYEGLVDVIPNEGTEKVPSYTKGKKSV